MTRTRSLFCCLLLAAATMVASAAELDDVAKLHRDGQSEAALQRADAFLATHPNDAQMRFLKAGVLADIGRTSDAIELLTRLLEDYPELAEPYNNLATLYAASGDYQRARAALEEALRVNPGYAIARENLGDVYAMLASQAYAEALRLQPDSTSLPPKLTLVRQLGKPPAAAPSVRRPG